MDTKELALKIVKALDEKKAEDIKLIRISELTVLADYFIIGFRIALPIFVSVMLVDCVLGILTKVASQLNMFAVGIQIKIIVGFIVMYLTISLLPQVANFIYQNMRAAMKLIAGGLT